MNIELLCVGKIKEKYLQSAIDEYVKRLSKFINIRVREIPEARVDKHEREADIQTALQKEADQILAKLPQAYVIALAIEGETLTSERFSEKLDEIFRFHPGNRIVFVIGSSYGLADAVKQRADYTMSFSQLTFPHQLMRVIALEQLYRAMKIMHNEPYHK